MSTVMEQIAQVRRAHHLTRRAATVERLPADSRLWLCALGHDYGRLIASLGSLHDADQHADATDPREALLDLLADSHAFLQAIDERPGVAVQTGVLDRYGVR